MVTTVQVKAHEHPIKSVTIFKSKQAEIVRTFSLSLKAGQNRVVILDLPSCIDTESARVSGLGDARLFDVVCTLVRKSSSVALAETEYEGIRLLEVQKEQLMNEKSIIEEQVIIFSTYARTLNGEHVSPVNMGDFVQDFLTQKKKALAAVFELKEKILEIERQIDREQERLSVRKGKTEAKVSAVIVCQNDGPVKLELTYIVGDAKWEPTYELHSTTENGKTSSSVSLHYRARITQTTGEDWKDVALSLSTNTTETLMAGIPPLQSAKIGTGARMLFGSDNAPDGGNSSVRILPSQQHMAVVPRPTSFFGSQPPVQAVAFSGSLFGASLPQPHNASPPNAEDSEVEEYIELEEEMQPVAEGATVVNKSPLFISYAVDGKSSIPSDGELHKVSVAVLPFEAEVTRITMPRQKAVAYMQSAVKNTSDYRLLPGPVAVFLDNSYVSRTSISDINVGDTFQCTFGTDTSVRISYTRTSSIIRDPFAPFGEQFKTTTVTSTTKISNQHSFPISIVSKDTVPLCNDKRVKVILKKPEGLVNAKETTVDLGRDDGIKVKWGKAVDDKGGEKEGKFEWIGTIATGKEVVLVMQWEVRCPIDVNWFEEGVKRN